ncbi:MAG: hypothetical protein HY329_24190, partial [Chloroflexi bacterium]|nr:hypothetical protein [Chloroflexota bacterium]
MTRRSLQRLFGIVTCFALVVGGSRLIGPASAGAGTTALAPAVSIAGAGSGTGDELSPMIEPRTLPRVPAGSKHPKLGAPFGALARTARADGAERALQVAKLQGVAAAADQVEVMIETRDDVTAVETALTKEASNNKLSNTSLASTMEVGTAATRSPRGSRRCA